jgi:hypothetical protein
VKSIYRLMSVDQIDVVRPDDPPQLPDVDGVERRSAFDMKKRPASVGKLVQ